MCLFKKLKCYFRRNRSRSFILLINVFNNMIFYPFAIKASCKGKSDGFNIIGNYFLRAFLICKIDSEKIVMERMKDKNLFCLAVFCI